MALEMLLYLADTISAQYEELLPEKILSMTNEHNNEANIPIKKLIKF